MRSIFIFLLLIVGCVMQTDPYVDGFDYESSKISLDGIFLCNEREIDLKEKFRQMLPFVEKSLEENNIENAIEIFDFENPVFYGYKEINGEDIIYFDVSKSQEDNYIGDGGVGVVINICKDEVLTSYLYQ